MRPQRIVDLVLRQRAADLDRIRRDQGTARRPLFGVPCAVKDNIDLTRAGLPAATRIMP